MVWKFCNGTHVCAGLAGWLMQQCTDQACNSLLRTSCRNRYYLISFDSFQGMLLNLTLHVLISIHPAQLLEHMQLVPLLDEALYLAILKREDRSCMPCGFLTRSLYSIMRLTTMRSLGTIPQQDMVILCEYHIIARDMQVCHARHDLGM